jgi:hypothetical protein
VKINHWDILWLLSAAVLTIGFFGRDAYLMAFGATWIIVSSIEGAK